MDSAAQVLGLRQIPESCFRIYVHQRGGVKQRLLSQYTIAWVEKHVDHDMTKHNTQAVQFYKYTSVHSRIYQPISKLEYLLW